MFAAGKAVSGAEPTDPQFNYVTMLLHGDGTNGAQNNTFLDSSTNAFTITRNGNTTQGTFTPYGSNWSNYFGTTTSNLKFASSASFAIGTGNFTIQCSVNFTAWASTNQRICIQGVSGTTNIQIARDSGANTLFVDIQGSTIISYAWTPNVGQWYDVAVVRSGTSTNQVALYIDGVSVATGTSSASIAQNQFIVGGLDWAAGYSMQGYISNLRYSNTARTVTVPTSPYTSDANTIILTCQSNRFIDNSSNSIAITVNSTPSVQRFSPFSPTTAYSTAVIGGSMYLDGTTDFVKTPSDVNLSSTLLASNFTIECWIYLAAYPSSGAAIWTNSVTNADGFTSSYINANGTVGTGKVNVNEFLTTTTIKLNTWTHFAIVRNSGTLYVYFNGVQDATTGAASTYLNTTATKPMQIGSSNQSPPTAMQGYMSDFRVVASAVYTTGFTPNTAPLTAISGTNLLLSTTNAGILDNAMMNDLETVGNAQISTSVKKYGTGSLAFDGTGDYLAEPTNLNFGYGSGNFTIEFWLYLNATSAQSIVSNLTSTASVNPHIYYSPTNGITYYVASVDRIIGGALSTSTWYHIALSRSSTSTKLFVNGAQVGSTYTDSNNYGTTAPLAVATYWESGTPSTVNTLNGYIDDLRISKVARYTANFTAPTAAFPNN